MSYRLIADILSVSSILTGLALLEGRLIWNPVRPAAPTHGTSSEFTPQSSPWNGPLSGRPKARRGGQALVFELHRGGEPAREVRLDGQTVPVVPYPYANQGLVELVLDPRPYAPTLEPDVLIYVPCHPFHQVADEHGVQRLTKLALSPGSACDDTVLSNLGACLAHAAGPAASENGPVIDHVAQAMTTHIAQKYGGLEAPSPPQSGAVVALAA